MNLNDSIVFHLVFNSINLMSMLTVFVYVVNCNVNVLVLSFLYNDNTVEAYTLDTTQYSGEWYSHTHELLEVLSTEYGPESQTQSTRKSGLEK